VVCLSGTKDLGKTTLIKCLLRLLKVENGTSKISGEDSWDLSAKVKSRIGYVGLKPYFYPWMMSLDVEFGDGKDVLQFLGSLFLTELPR